MNNQTTDARRDEVLFAFHQQCERPTAEQIIRWTSRYPEFADDIREHAAICMDWNAMEEGPALEPSTELLARGRSRALNAIHKAQAAAKTAAEPAGESSFEALMAANSATVPQLAREFDIERSVIADVTAGLVRPPLGERLRQALAQAFQTTAAAVDSAHRLACASPRLGHAKASRAPTVVTRSYEEAIRASSMPPERQAYWLDED